MDIRNGTIEAIGRTPLVKLKKVSELTGCTILGKAEYANPGGSVKDRAALAIIRDAEARGLLKPGGVIVEGTAGNTGIGLATVGNALGYRTVIVIPETQSQEKKDLLRLLGADLREVPAVPYRDQNNYVHVSRRLAEELANIQIGLADPMGAALYSHYKFGELKSEGSSISEGIGQGRITANLEGVDIDHAFQISDEEMLPIVFDLLMEEGLCMGGSTGINVAGAVRLARELGPGKTIVTILCDLGTRYQSKLWNPAFLKEKGLPSPDWL
jgi:cysteine synthase A